MTENKVTLEEVRLALGNTTDARGYRKFSPGGRVQAVEYARERLKTGAAPSEVAEELGLIGWTLQRWLQRERQGAMEPAPGFVKLEVKAIKREPVLHGRCGVWVEGLEPEGIAAVLRSLSCSA